MLFISFHSLDFSLYLFRSFRLVFLLYSTVVSNIPFPVSTVCRYPPFSSSFTIAIRSTHNSLRPSYLSEMNASLPSSSIPHSWFNKLYSFRRAYADETMYIFSFLFFSSLSPIRSYDCYAVRNGNAEMINAMKKIDANATPQNST